MLGWTSTKQGLMCLAQGHNGTQRHWWGSNPQPLSFESSTLLLSHCAPWLRVHIVFNIGYTCSFLLRGISTSLILKLVRWVSCPFDKNYFPIQSFKHKSEKFFINCFVICWFFSKSPFRNTTQVSNSLDPDQAGKLILTVLYENN